MTWELLRAELPAAKVSTRMPLFTEGRTFSFEEELNLYSFVLNDGINSVDPDGLRRGKRVGVSPQVKS